VGDVGGLLGAAATAGEAFAAAAAAHHVAWGRLARVAERLAAVAEQQVAAPLHRVGGGSDAEELRHRIVVRLEVLAAGARELGRPPPPPPAGPRGAPRPSRGAPPRPAPR